MEWIKKNLWQVILTTLVTVILSTGGTMFVYQATKRDKALDGAATKAEVDSKISETRTYIDVKTDEMKLQNGKDHSNYEKRFETIEGRQLQKADKSDIEEVKSMLKDQNLAIKDQNKMIFDILKEVKK